MRASRLTENPYDRPNKNNFNNFDYMPPQQNNYHTINNGGYQGYRHSIDPLSNQYHEAQKSERRYQ